MPANKVRFAICGTTYTISTTDSEEYVLSLAEKLDGDMNQMMAASRTASVATAAIITALGYLDELKKSTTGADNMRAQIRDYLEDHWFIETEPPEPLGTRRREVVFLEIPLQRPGENARHLARTLLKAVSYPRLHQSGRSAREVMRLVAVHRNCRWNLRHSNLGRTFC